MGTQTGQVVINLQLNGTIAFSPGRSSSNWATSRLAESKVSGMGSKHFTSGSLRVIGAMFPTLFPRPMSPGCVRNSTIHCLVVSTLFTAFHLVLPTIIVLTLRSGNQPVAECTHAKLPQSSLTLCDPMDCRRPGSSVPGILQAGIVNWVAMPSSKEFFTTQGWNLLEHFCVSCTGRRVLYH